MSDRQKTKENHFVPQFYLKYFADKNCRLHCLDLNNKKCYPCTDFRQVCKKKNLYLIKNKISDSDKELLLKLLGNISIEDIDFCNQLTEMLNGTLGNLFSIVTKDSKIQNDLNHWMQELLNTKNYSRKQESLFTFIENDFQPLYEKLIKNENIQSINCDNEDIKLYLYMKVYKYIHQELYYDLKNAIKSEYKKNYEEIPKLNLLKTIKSIPYIDIAYYMLNQYFRTEKIITDIRAAISNYSNKLETYLKQQLPDEKFNIDNLIFLFINIQPIFLIKNMVKDNYRLVFLKNKTYTPFIISDNPCINMHANADKKQYEADELEIYFPLTPKAALLFTKRTNIDKQIEDVNIIDTYNKCIIKNAERYIYANDEMILKKYKN